MSIKSPIPNPRNYRLAHYEANLQYAENSFVGGWGRADALWIKAVEPHIKVLQALWHEDGSVIVHPPAPDESIVRVDIRQDVWDDLCALDLAPFA